MSDRERLLAQLRGRIELERWFGVEWLPRSTAQRPAAPVSREAPRTTGSASALAAIGAEAAGCTKCGLSRTRKNVVFGVGNPAARLVLVGEAPGMHEDETGEPFVGAAGGLLTRMLAKIELAREDVYICNVIKCRPPQNRSPTIEEKAHCSPFLFRQLEAIAPQAILALGGHAAKTLLDLPPETTTGSLRGRLHRWRETPVVVTYHPAYLLREPQDRWKSLDDLLMVKKVLVGEV